MGFILLSVAFGCTHGHFSATGVWYPYEFCCLCKMLAVVSWVRCSIYMHVTMATELLGVN